MPAEITMPQQSDTMTEGTVVKWLKKEGDQVKAGEVIAEIETDKATMEMEAFDSGTLAVILTREGQKAPVGASIAVLATAKDNPADVKQKYASGAAAQPKSPAPAPSAAPTPKPAQPAAPTTATAPSPKPAPNAQSAIRTPQSFQYDVIVIGGGPAGYAAAIRAGQLKKRVLCVEKENLGGTCLNWGCIPTKALLEDGAFARKVRTEAAAHGLTIGDVKVDFPKMIGRSRAIADKLSKGIASLFKKYEVKSEFGTGMLLGPHKVRINGKDSTKDVTADHVIIAVGARSTPLPFAPFDG